MAHSYWRLYITASNGSAATSLAELQFRSTPGGPNICNVSSGGPFGSGYSQSNAFNGNLNDNWGYASLPAYIGWQFATPVDIAEYVIYSRNDSGGANMPECPKSWQLQYSDDGSSWTTATTVTNQTYWGLGAALTMEGGSPFLRTSSDSAAVLDSIVTSTWPNRYPISTTEGPALTDTLSYSYQIGGSVKETLKANDYYRIGFGKATADSLTVNASLTANIGALLADYLLVSTTLLAKWRGNETAKDVLLTVETANLAKVYQTLLQETITVSLDDGTNFSITVVDLIKALEDVSHNSRVSRLIADAVLVTDSLLKGYGVSLQDVMALQDPLTFLYLMACIANDAVGIGGTVTSGYTANALVISAVSIPDGVASHVDLLNVLHDGLEVGFRLVLDGETYQCWVLNTDQTAPSFYTNFAFNSFATLGDSTYAARKDGIYLLGGPTDADSEIATGVQVNPFNFGTHWKKRMHTAYFGVTGATPMVKAITDEGDVSYYVVDGRISTTKGHEGREWKFNLIQVDAVDFVELTPLILVR